MKTESLNTSDTKVHSQNIQQMLGEVIDHFRQDVEKVDDPRFEALLETGAEVVGGLRTAFEHYSEKSEKAWKK